MSLHASISTLAARWKSEGIELVPASTASELAATFASLGSKATQEVIHVYGALGGMSEMDNEYWRLWSLEEIREANVKSTEAGVLFSDYCLDCYQYRLKPVCDAISEVWVEGFDYGPPVRIAKSLEAFFASYIKNPDEVLSAPPSRPEFAPRDA